jgi:hypothetical protein
MYEMLGSKTVFGGWTQLVGTSILFSLHRILFPVSISIGLIDLTVPLHLREECAKEEAQLASRMPSGRFTGFAEMCRVWRARGN